eukprot:3323001-Alexandrium_andersonii.AAC.1
MSASLVGSEMCIRDSLVYILHLWQRSVTYRKWHQASSIGEGPRQGTHAVSYTHLTLPTICSV